MNPYSALSAPILHRWPELTAEDLQFGPAPKIEVGDVALRTFVAAKKLQLAPPAFAAAIFKEVSFGPEVRSVSPAGPYVNFKLNRGQFTRDAVAAILDAGNAFGSERAGAGEKLLIEHTSINPNASPHVGRARNAMVGDSLVRLSRFEGYDVTVHYYVNDMGKQIALLVLVCDDLARMTFDDMLDKYVEANARAETDEAFAAAGYELLAKMEQGDPETASRFYAVTERCLQGQLAVLARLGIQYDVFDRESRFLKDPRLDEVVAALQTKEAIFTDEDNRLVVDLSKLGHDRDEGRFFVLMRANGSSMYGYRDLAYTIDKMESKADVNLWVLGEDHKLYAEQQRMILAAANKSAPEVIYYAYILLREGKMSTRQGNVVLLSEFLDEAIRRAAEKVDTQCADLPIEERRAIAEKVAVAAVRFAILRINLSKNVIFEWESSLSFNGDTGPYVQYSCARINSILRKYGATPALSDAPFPTDSNAEWALVSLLVSFPEVVAVCAKQRQIAPIAQFALDAARAFTTFYHDCPVLAAESESLRDARLLLCMATRQVLTNALSILGIDTVERM